MTQEKYYKFENRDQIIEELEKIQSYLLNMSIKGSESANHSMAINALGAIGLNLKNDFSLEKKEKESDLI